MSDAERSSRPVLITGGAGFVGANVARRILEGGERVVLFDDLSRPWVARNVDWLRGLYGSSLDLCVGDVRDAEAVARAVAACAHVFHFAAQVAVTTSLSDPGRDFDVNARGTLNVLEAIRAQRDPPSLLFTSTNKVYGALADVRLQREGRRWEPADPLLRAGGVTEARPLDFHSPYGCSKGAADQYVVDYARTFRIPAAVFRMSCVYGPRQFGSEDQGWVAHFVGRALRGEPITVYGDGFQVRDLLFVDDLVDAFVAARRAMRRVSGMAFNIGGGPATALSLLELVDLVSEVERRRAPVRFEEPRPGDQRWYVSSTGRFGALTGWAPRVRPREGVRALAAWMREAMAEPAASVLPAEARR
jgi:CDP-paratose 2-epimerase